MQKYAVLSDIHSNVFALKAVIKDAKRRGVTKFINLGDIFYGPIAPRATYEELLDLDIVTICGNQDRQIFDATAEEIDSNPTMQFILRDLGEAPLEWMKSLPFDVQISKSIYACHGTPSDDLVYLLEETTSGRPYVRAEESIRELLGNVDTQVVLCGHTHIPRCVNLSQGQRVINPGSVGLQAYTDDEPHLHSMENCTPDASYALLEQDNDQWQVSFHRVAYDVKSAVNEALKRDRHDWAHFLATGRKM
ncbi:metallophosphoesterase family protein [Vibrio sonorensis]|uniref:metallophosphoesterase family protein n=1 Tax=Vibrio sonorensis TaxID=1004316 RepID=UPI0008D9ECD5|nr:metallophosphoesterase family protein [Vibrio sonorensis]